MSLSTNAELAVPPSIYDQYFIVSSLNATITSDGKISFIFVPPSSANKPSNGYVLLNQNDLERVITFEVGEFYLPKLPSWNNTYLAYQNRICLEFSPLDRYGFTDYRISLGEFTTNIFAFEFSLVDVGDRYLLKPQELGSKMILRTPINIPSGLASIRFSTPQYDLPLVTPYITVVYALFVPGFGPGVGTSGFILTNPNITNYFSGNYIVFNTPNIPGIDYTPTNIYTIDIINVPPSPTVPSGFNGIGIGNLQIPSSELGKTMIMSNLSLAVRIPFRSRQLQIPTQLTNRIVPAST